MTTYTESDIKVGTKINCHGYPGTVSEVCTGVLTGMCVVKLRTGSVCVGISELVQFQNYSEA
jgi:hypothetical protein